MTVDDIWNDRKYVLPASISGPSVKNAKRRTIVRYNAIPRSTAISPSVECLNDAQERLVLVPSFPENIDHVVAQIRNVECSRVARVLGNVMRMGSYGIIVPCGSG